MPRVLGSLPPGVNVLVIDHESTDGTSSVAQQLGARAIVRKFENFVDARRFALANVATPWTLMIDADEQLDPQLRDAVLNAPETHDAYEMRRTTLFCGKPLRMWRGERVLRFFKTDRVTLEAAPAAGGDALLHERWRTTGSIGVLPGALIHDSYPTREQYDAKFERYTQTEARGLRASRAALLREAFQVPVRFSWTMLRRGALMDGPGGWYVAWKSAQYRMVVQWKALR